MTKEKVAVATNASISLARKNSKMSEGEYQPNHKYLKILDDMKISRNIRMAN